METPQASELGGEVVCEFFDQESGAKDDRPGWTALTQEAREAPASPWYRLLSPICPGSPWTLDGGDAWDPTGRSNTRGRPQDPNQKNGESPSLSFRDRAPRPMSLS